MTEFVVVVSLQVQPERLASFRALVLANAATSKACEPGCRRFDVSMARGDPNAFLLYEIYDNRDAFQAHLATEHFLSFDKLTASMVLSKTVLELDLCAGGATDTQDSETPAAADTEVRL